MIRSASWIGCANDLGSICPVFFRQITIEKEIERAVFSVTAAGVYEAHLNGKRIGNFVLAPGGTSYKKRLQYQTYDVTGLFDKNNDISVTVGTGWYRGRISRKYEGIVDTPCAVIAELVISYADGTKETIKTDELWKVRKSKILFSDIYDGEIYDASAETEEVFDTKVLELTKETLIPQEGEIVCEHERVKPVKFFVSPKGERIIDFGQNLAGYVEIHLQAKGGTEVELSHAEVLDADGNFYTENYRSAQSKLKYICCEGEQTYKPHFTFFGFRYIRLDKYPKTVNPDDFTAIAVYSDIKRTGYMKCSNDKVNRLYENTLWSQRSNFIDIPTDCPQRDERMGWTGDAQMFSKTASYHYDVKRFFEKWMKDVCADQFEDGGIPDVVPNYWCKKGCSTAWGDAITVIPWQMYLTYGDTKILEDCFDSMTKWIDFITNDTKDQYLWTCSEDDKVLWRKHYGDWLALDAPAGSYKGASDDDFIASAFYAHSVKLVIKSGRVIGRDVSAYEALYEQIVKHFKERFHQPKTQTEHVVALYFDLTDEKERTAAKLNEMICANGNKLKTGFVGTPYLLHVLSDYGYTETAYALLLQEDYPSWLYEVNHGATTIWEHWDGINDSGTFWSRDMNSYNHYAYGAVMDWVYEAAAGIRVDETRPGFERILVEPKPDQRLEWLDVSFETKAGTVRSAWSFVNGKPRYEIEVPVDSIIKIDKNEYKVTKGTYIY